jgi:hypothetical protein
MIKWRKTAVSTILFVSLTIPFSVAGAEGMMDSKPAMMEMNMQDMKQNMNMQDMNQGMNMQTMIPLRNAAESMGFTVMWNGMDNTITLTKTSMNQTDMSSNNGMETNSMMGMYNITLKIGSKSVKINNEEKMIQDAPSLMDDRTYVTKDFIDMFFKKQMMMEKK